MTTGSEPLSDARQRQVDATRARLSERTPYREHYVDVLKQPGGILQADSPDRVRKRMDRLAKYYTGAPLPVTPEEADRADENDAERRLREVVKVARSAEGAPTAAPRGPLLLESIINTNDLLDVRFLDAGAAAARAVARVWMYENRTPIGYGSGFLVSPRLLLTNHHVLPSGDIAAGSRAEFNYQLGVDSQPLHSVLFDLDPDAFFITDGALDFSLVALRDSSGALVDFGALALVGAEGKAVIGECVNIVQHPGGERKRIAIRENRIVDLFDDFLHYETDTEPGSSGSPVFNDQWEIVALHHASVRANDHPELKGIANEGIRASRLLKHIFDAGGLSSSQRALRDQLNPPSESSRSAASQPGSRLVTTSPPVLRPTGNGGRADGNGTGKSLVAVSTAGLGGSTTDGSSAAPIEIVIRLNPALFAAATSSATAPTRAPSISVGPAPDTGDRVEEVISIDPDYSTRKGYETGFLGKGFNVTLPSLSDAMKRRAAVSNQPQAGHQSYVLPYHHFSVVVSKERQIAFFTAVNIDGSISNRIKREADKWIYDPRIERTEQLGNEIYQTNALDRGHLVRRLDPAWGKSLEIAKTANDDTFHFTNCSPQHEDFNQNDATWAGLEDYILDNAIAENLRVNVFSGPVFAKNDPPYRGAKLPKQFWKVVSMVTDQHKLSATAYLLSQASLLQDLESLEFAFGAYRTFQVPVDRVERITGLSFGRLGAHDPLRNRSGGEIGRESTAQRPISSFEDIVF
jgi:endonuclease G